MNKKENENLETEEVVEEQAVEEQVVEEQVVEPEEELVEEPVVIDPIKVLEEERDDFKDKWMRAAAETENVRKRGRRDV
ncbi:nucleotide exchange factor GrpE, partial [bacterium]|nr:nucleotide exchange factor GrpE [bacterium]